MQQFGTETLGKGVVVGKDAPAFIGNRIGLFGFANMLRRMAEGDSAGGGAYTVGEVDTIFGAGKWVARNSAVFRTTDPRRFWDTTYHVAKNIYENCPDDEAHDVFKLPDWVEAMFQKGMLGDKTGGGFYQKRKDANGETLIVEIEPATLGLCAAKEVVGRLAQSQQACRTTSAKS